MSDALARLRAARAFLLDMDGTLYIDERALPGDAALVALLEQRGCRYLMLSNNSSARASDYHARLARLGIHVAPDRVLTSGEATADFLVHRTPHRRPLVLGTPAFEAVLREAGLEVNGTAPDCVVVGYDKTLTYDKLARACRLVWDGAPYFATHPDYTCITAGGLVPDIRIILAGIRELTGRWPLVIGKPEPPIVEMALRRLDASAAEAVMVGDQLDTDIAMARRSGLLGVCVLSGETARAQAEAAPQPPDLVVGGVAELVALLGG